MINEIYYPTKSLPITKLLWAWFISLPLNLLNLIALPLITIPGRSRISTKNNIEITCDNWFGRWMYSRGWGGFSFGSFRYYWTTTSAEDPFVTIHEKHHTFMYYNEPVHYIIRYLLNMRKGYTCNAIENECYDFANVFVNAKLRGNIKII